MFRTTRTRSRAYLDPPTKPGTPLKHKHAVTPVRRPPKRRRLGVSALSTNRLGQSSDSDDSDFELYRSRGRLLPPGSPLMLNRGRKAGARLRSKLADDEDTAAQSPRKRKRHGPGSGSSAGSDSWVETEDDEAPELIGEDDQHLLQDAPATSLHRLRKSELIRLWKVAGMWLSEEDEMDEGGEDGRDLGKSELVEGLIKARKQFGDPSPGLSSPSLERAFSPMVLRSRSNSTLTSPPSSSSEDSPHPPEMDVDSTPKAVLKRSRLRPHGDNQRSVLRRKGAPKQGDHVQKPKGKVNRRSRVRIASTLPVEHTPRFKRRSSTLSSTYTTTSDGSADEQQPAHTTVRKSPHVKSGRPRTTAIQIDDAFSGVRATPVIQRLRPRRGPSIRSNNSTEVDADAEDNGDDEGPASSSSSVYRQQSEPEPSLKRDKHDRQAKSEALKALNTSSDNVQHGGPSQEASMTSVEDAVPPDHSPVRTSPRRKSSSSRRASVKGAKPTEPRQDDIDVDPQPVSLEDIGVRTTRSGKPFGDLEPREQTLEYDDDDEDMDADDTEMSSEWVANFDFTTATVSSLTRLRREELVRLCEANHLEVGGTKLQLARVLLDWYAEQQEQLERTSNSSQSTARPESPRLVHAVASNSRTDGVATPVLLRDHIHATDPATPPRSDDDPARSTENDLNFDLQELGLEDFTIKPEHLVKLEKIGSGGFKDVYVGKLRGRKVAISEFRSHLSEMDIRELKLLAEFRHPNIVRFRGICIPEDSSQVPCMLISELCENGDLFDYIRNVPPQPLKRVLRLMLDIARGLEYLHLRQPAIIHRDCKSTNILITRQGVAKVGDFGLARVKHSTRSMIRSLVGTVNWQAPELWHPTPRYDYKVDVFSAALVFWEMLSGWFGEQKYPWEGHNEHYIYDAVGQKQKRPPLSGLRKHWGAEPVNLIERMWHQDPAERPTMSDVVADLEALIADCR